jgi:hypothetical protein
MPRPTEAEFSAQVGRFFPPEALAFVFNIFDKESFSLKVTPPRESKKGDYRPPTPQRRLPLITVNGDLPPYEFLVVYLHEVAHYMTYKEYKKNITPHGKEWKNQYRQLFQKLFSAVALPEEVKSAFETHLKHVKSSSVLDVTLNVLFRKYDTKNSNEVFVKELQLNDLFLYQKEVFRFDGMIRTRARCIKIRNNSLWVLGAHAKVVKIN